MYACVSPLRLAAPRVTAFAARISRRVQHLTLALLGNPVRTEAIHDLPMWGGHSIYRTSQAKVVYMLFLPSIMDGPMARVHSCDLKLLLQTQAR